MTIAMLSLAGIPGTVGFIGKFQLIHALVDGDYTWLAIVLVIGSMISLGYYLRVVAAMWMRRPATRGRARAGRAGARADRRRLAGGRRGARRPRREPARWPAPVRAIPDAEVVFVARRVRRREHLLRDLPLAAVPPRRARGARAQRPVLIARGRGLAVDGQCRTGRCHTQESPSGPAASGT